MIEPVHLYTGLILAEMYADAIKNSDQQLSLGEFHELAKQAAMFGHTTELAFEEVQAVIDHEEKASRWMDKAQEQLF
jgi:predicted aminopeptidase